MKIIKALCIMLLMGGTHFATAAPDSEEAKDARDRRGWRTVSTHTPPEDVERQSQRHNNAQKKTSILQAQEVADDQREEQAVPATTVLRFARLGPLHPHTLWKGAAVVCLGATALAGYYLQTEVWQPFYDDVQRRYAAIWPGFND